MTRKLSLLLLTLALALSTSSFADHTIVQKSTDPGGGGDAPNQCRFYTGYARIIHFTSDIELDPYFSLYVNTNKGGWFACTGVPHEYGAVGSYYLDHSIVDVDDYGFDSFCEVYVRSLAYDGYSSDNRIPTYDFN